MKYYKRLGVYKASNVTFHPDTISAYSYGWWKFVGVVDGKVVFNNHRYSNSTSKHQLKVKRLLRELGIKIDIEMPLVGGLPGSYLRYGQTLSYSTLKECIEIAETELCNDYLEMMVTRQDRYQKRKAQLIAIKEYEAKGFTVLRNWRGQVRFNYDGTPKVEAPVLRAL